MLKFQAIGKKIVLKGPHIGLIGEGHTFALLGGWVALGKNRDLKGNYYSMEVKLTQNIFVKDFIHSNTVSVTSKVLLFDLRDWVIVQA
jgi:hypothetical protein